MQGFKAYLFMCAVIGLFFSCAYEKPVIVAELKTLEALRLHYNPSLLTKKKTNNAIRLTGIKEVAQGLGAQAALAWRAKRVNATLEREQRKLDRIYNFSALLLPHNVLPPVLQTANNSLELKGDNVLRISDSTFRIAEQARFVTAAPTWRTYLWMNYAMPALPHDTMLPHTFEEQKVWKKGIREGWVRGVRQADTIFQENLQAISVKFTGMVLYRKLLAQRMVSPPYVAKVELGVTGNGKRMDVNDKVLRITTLPSLNHYSDSWFPGVSLKSSA